MSQRKTKSDERLVKAIRMAIIAWNSLGPRKTGDDVSQFIADWLVVNRVTIPPAGDGDH
jgi:hypothetical protein